MQGTVLLLGGPASSTGTHGSVLVRGEVPVQGPSPHPVTATALSLNSPIAMVATRTPTASLSGMYTCCKPLRAVGEETCCLGSWCRQPPTPAPWSPEVAHELSEAGPLTGVVVPTASHEGVEDRWAEVGLGQPVPLLQHPNDVLVLQPEEGLLAKAQDLPHADS